MFTVCNPVQGFGRFLAASELNEFPGAARHRRGDFLSDGPAGAAKTIQGIVNGVPVIGAVDGNQDELRPASLVEPF